MGGASKTNCAGCTQPFTFLVVRHLCRSCGDGFCHSCSSGKRYVSGHSDPVRVCDMCLHAEDRKAQVLRQTSSTAERQATNGQLDADELKRLQLEQETMNSLKRIYKAKIRVLEQQYSFTQFSGLSELSEADFDQRPMVLLIGQYSVGKTSFMRYLMKKEIPAMRIGPEPTTDRFLAVHSALPGGQQRVIPGNAAAVDIERPYTALSRYGVSFLSRFEVAEVEDAEMLDKVILVDTPGILAGNKQSEAVRGYRADRILLIFDSSKLDISDELKESIQRLRAYDDKMRIVLNKSDLVAPQTLLRVVGALMFNLGRIIQSPEIPRVYISSFWDRPFDEVSKPNHPLFELERRDLLDELNALPRESAIRRINELVKRTRMVRIHALLVNSMRSSLPMWNASKAEKKFQSRHRLGDEFERVRNAHGMAHGDMPDIDSFQIALRSNPLSNFKEISKRQLDVLDGALSRDIPQLMFALGTS